MTELIPPSAPMNPIRSVTRLTAACASGHPPHRATSRHRAAGSVVAGSGRLPNHPLRGDDPTTREPHTERAIPSSDAHREAGRRVDRELTDKREHGEPIRIDAGEPLLPIPSES